MRAQLVQDINIITDTSKPISDVYECITFYKALADIKRNHLINKVKFLM
jgi:hypothetical protein